MEKSRDGFIVIADITGYTTRLIPQGDSTIVRVMAGRYTGRSGILLKLRKLDDRHIGAWGQKKGLRNLRERIEKEIAEGALQQPELPTVPVEEVERSVAESLAVEKVRRGKSLARQRS